MSVSDFEPQLANCNVISGFFLLEQPHSISPQKSKIIIISGDVLVLVISLILPKFKEISYFYDTNFIFIFTLLTAFVIPMIILIKHKLQVKEGIAK